ncbi:NAD(P)-dependent oxidoreductase [Nocardioides sp.]|uniref:NAD-dependent epimerase/dehydratase family protein n=1 Tax=Nocardioides sp. TaxID=35761 RepID=UPI002612BFE5|nr:NAD(P)-dependent oxidoreductase [Nocardioides sp.]
MKVVVTGARGFIGRRLVSRLAASGHEVIAVVRPGSVSLADADTVECDLGDLRSLPTLVDEADVIVHLAWAGANPESRHVPAAQLPNLAASLDLVDAAAHMGVERIVCAGSMSEFGLHRGPVSGAEPSSPVDLYAAAKVAARELMGVRCAQSGVGLVWTMITSVYGPDREDSNLITYAIDALLRGERPSTTGLEQIWDYLYVDDLIEALHLIVEHGRAGARYPIGSGVAKPLASYVEAIRDAIDPSLPLGIGEVPYKSAVLDSSIPDISRLIADTGFAAATAFSTGIAATIAARRERLRPAP